MKTTVNEKNTQIEDLTKDVRSLQSNAAHEKDALKQRDERIVELEKALNSYIGKLQNYFILNFKIFKVYRLLKLSTHRFKPGTVRCA